MTERFNPRQEKPKKRIIASFTRTQLKATEEWLVKSVLSNYSLPDDLGEALEVVEPDEKKRLRLLIGVDLLERLREKNRSLDELHQVLVWETGPNVEDHEVEWKFYNRRLK